MNTQYRCKNQERRRLVREARDEEGNPFLNGIDFIEVEYSDHQKLWLHFLHNLPGQVNGVPAAPELSKENIVIECDNQVNNIQVISAGSYKNTQDVLEVKVDRTGGFSTHRLRLVTSPTEPQPPSGFDPQLSAVDFSFKIDSFLDFDCKNDTECPPPRLVEPEIDYLAKDYASFRRLMLDRLNVLMPDWRERNPADWQIALVELLAYVGDQLSYYQDAVATEAYLGTARHRISVRRHARLLDYLMHDGCNARTWVWLAVEKCKDSNAAQFADGINLPAGTLLLTRSADSQRVIPTEDRNKALAEGPTVFETMHDLMMHEAHNRISFYTWGDSECCLPRGATRATLRNDSLKLQVGDVLIFEEVCSTTNGLEAAADPTHRQAVRLIKIEGDKDPPNQTEILNIEWHAEDALLFPLCLTAGDGNKEISVARGNVVLADQGLTFENDGLPRVPIQGRYRPQLPDSNLSFAVPYDHDQAKQKSATSALVQDPRAALPAGSGKQRKLPMTLSDLDGDEVWCAQRELLNSDRFAAEFVVETEQDGSAYLRFGDGTLGKAPAASVKLNATYRVGNGRAGNVGADALTRIVTDLKGISSVTNPLPAGGGTDAETLEEVRQFAPQAFRKQERAVTEADYAEVAGRHPQVQKAAARFQWTGSWHTVFITIDRKGGLPVKSDEQFHQEIRAHLELYRLAGYDLEITDPIFVPLDLAMLVSVKPGYFNSNVKASLLQVFSNRDLPNGQRGFFHPDNFTFGQPVYLSKVYQTAMSVAGVASVVVTTFQRYGRVTAGEKDTDVLRPAALEIIQLDNDPNFPEHGRIIFDVQGGL